MGTAKQASLLLDVIGKRCPELLRVAREYVVGAYIDDSAGDQIVECLSDEILKYGIREDYSFTSYGDELETLQDLVLRAEGD